MLDDPVSVCMYISKMKSKAKKGHVKRDEYHRQLSLINPN